MEREVELKNHSGLHARPASVFVGEASKFKSDVFIEVNDKRVNAKSILGLLTLGIGKDTIIKIIAEGPDENNALDTLCELVASGIGE